MELEVRGGPGQRRGDGDERFDGVLLGASFEMHTGEAVEACEFVGREAAVAEGVAEGLAAMPEGGEDDAAEGGAE
ncbi:MAG: hypothetical protein GYA57_05280, partial [Myxococcales bacterium]|nr:hypothetical protein [Myxococcales bacterium]